MKVGDMNECAPPHVSFRQGDVCACMCGGRHHGRRIDGLVCLYLGMPASICVLSRRRI